MAAILAPTDFLSLNSSEAPTIQNVNDLEYGEVFQLMSNCGTQNQGVFGRLLAVRQKSYRIAYSR